MLFEVHVLPDTPIQVTKFGSTYRWHQNFLEQYVSCGVLEIHIHTMFTKSDARSCTTQGCYNRILNCILLFNTCTCASIHEYVQGSNMLSSVISLMGMECRVIFVAAELLLLPKVPDFRALAVLYKKRFSFCTVHTTL